MLLELLTEPKMQLFDDLTKICHRYCYECINKATGERHCLVCGSQDGANLIHCTSCPRAYHMTCIQPALTKVRSTMLNFTSNCITD